MSEIVGNIIRIAHFLIHNTTRPRVRLSVFQTKSIGTLSFEDAFSFTFVPIFCKLYDHAFVVCRYLQIILSRF